MEEGFDLGGEEGFGHFFEEGFEVVFKEVEDEEDAVTIVLASFSGLRFLIGIGNGNGRIGRGHVYCTFRFYSYPLPLLPLARQRYWDDHSPSRSVSPVIQ